MNFTPKIEPVCFSEASEVSSNSTPNYNMEHLSLYTDCFQNLKYCFN